MSDAPLDREMLVEIVTREVLATLAERSDICATPEKLAAVVANGADRVAYHGDPSSVPLELAKYIDHTILNPDATAADVDKLCAEAEEYGFAAVCVNPTWIKRCARNLRGSGVTICSVIGFPFGATTPQIKAMEARQALRDGAREVDMVLNIGALKSGDHELVRGDIEKVVDSAHEAGALVKVIIETCLLTDEEKVTAAALAKAARADFVKTSTGFAGGGATVFDVALIRETVGPAMGVKASGGVRTTEDAQDLIAAGASRIGASASLQIVDAEGAASGDRY